MLVSDAVVARECNKAIGVLILVLVDVGLGRPWIAAESDRAVGCKEVLILVLVDVGLGLSDSVSIACCG